MASSFLACTPRLDVVRAGGAGPPTLMLLHGYGSSAAEWLPFTHTIALPSGGRFLFPQAVFDAPREDGRRDGRAWWPLDLAAHQRHGRPGVDLSTEDPRGLERAARSVRATMAREGNQPERPFILGGFSQGAIVACEIAFGSDEPLAALVILSGTTMNLDAWRLGLARRRGLPVFMAHGRKDDILPFDLAERVRHEMTAAGLTVTFVPFDGGHEIPAEVVGRLGEFLARVTGARDAAARDAGSRAQPAR